MRETDSFKHRIVAIIRGVTPAEAVDIGRVILDAGIEAIEVPLNSPDPFQSISLLAAAFGDRALVGAGTVLSVENVEKVHETGGKLIVSPNTNVDVIRRTKELGMMSLPGFATATEAFAAIHAGADALKLFPAGSNGPETIKALKAVLPGRVPVLAVGGVSPDNMAGFVAAGVLGFGLGSTLYKPGMLAQDVAKTAAESVAACAKAFE